MTALDMKLQADLIRPFVPARDWALSKRFYEDLGFAKTFDDGATMAVFTLGATSFYLQNLMWDGAATNYMLLLRVDDVEAWWAKIERLAKSYGLRVRPPQDEPWGARNLHLADPSGVLWHIAEFRG
jgi:uncharacterized glyoxalase superfamily protein PhnB